MRFRLFQEDKEGLLRILAVIVFIGVLIVSIVLRKFAPAYFVVVAILLYQQLVAIPEISKHYHTLNGLEDNWKRYIPIWNNIRIFTPTMAIVTMVVAFPMLFLAFILLLTNLIPEVMTTIASSLFGELRGRVISYFVVVWLLIATALYLVVEGIGYFGVKQDVDLEYIKKYKSVVKASESIQYIMLLIPLSRAYSLVMVSARLKKMASVNVLGTPVMDEFELKGRMYQ